MGRRVVLSWVMVGVVLSALAAMMLLAGVVTKTTHYPSPTSSPSKAAPGNESAVTNPADPGRPVPPHVAVITFVGGPSPRAADQLLGVLRPMSVPATFFVTGSEAVQHPEALRSIAAAGAEIGNGGFTYTDLSRVSGWRRKLELNATEAAVVGATGRSTTLVRPYGPGSEALGNRIMPGVGDFAGYAIVPSGSTPTRWDNPGPQELLDQVLPPDGDGVIVTLPATDHQLQNTAKALPVLIAGLRDRGYTFKTVSAALGSSTQASMPAASSTAVVVAWLAGHAVRDSVAFVRIIGWLLLPLGIVTVLRTVLVTGLALIQVRSERRDSGRAAPYRGPVSIVVPAYNEEANIVATVSSLLASDYPTFEVIVVDDGSTDSTPDLLAGLADRVRVLRQRNSGKATALNYGVAHARHDVVVMVDGDTVFEPATLAALVAPMSDPGVGAVAGNTKVANRRGLLGRWQHLEYVIGMNLDRRMFQLLDCMPTVPGAVGAFRREALFEATNGVPTRTLAEDTDLTMAINLSGWRVVYAARAIAWTEAPSKTSALARQRFRWCYGTLQAMWAHRRSVRPVAGSGVGHVGSRGIPYLVMFQVLQPLLAPMIDLYLIYAFVFLDVRAALIAWGVFIALQMLSACVALRLDGESLRTVWALPITQFYYRQLLYLVVLQSVASAISGSRLRWHQPPRSGAAARQMYGTT
jgi:cellulose synthase/poly-beta-1,6-N-acetylglucosamine synthase-like glycosyltransferase/peptidoglycan/xylan/chitin deacetylase (PgdA/CDA1 family)